MNMDELLKNIYVDSDSFPTATDHGDGVSAVGTGGVKTAGNKTVDDVWKEIVSGVSGGGGDGTGGREAEMTLEDFLTKAGAVREEDARLPVIAPPPSGFEVDSMMNAAGFSSMRASQNGSAGFGLDSMGLTDGIAARIVVAGGPGGSGGDGRGKRSLAEEPAAADRATQQKQRRMIKNRESAARSRERKQAYTVELESLVTQLEDENARILRDEAEQTKRRFRQLMENLIPVAEKRRPARALRRVHSMCW